MLRDNWNDVSVFKLKRRALSPLFLIFLCSGCGHLAPPLRARARRHRDDRQRLRVQGLRRHLVSERTHDGVRRVARQQPGRFAAQRLRGPALQVRLGRGRITELVPQLLDLQLEEAAGAGRPHGLDLAPQPLPPPGVEAKFNSEILKPFYLSFFRELFCFVSICFSGTFSFCFV